MTKHYILHTTLTVSTCLLISGLTVCMIDLDEYSWGLYMVLVAIVGLLLCIAFCILGPEHTAEPTIAKQLWNRATIKLSGHRASVVRKRNSGAKNGDGNGEEEAEGDSNEDGLLQVNRLAPIRTCEMTTVTAAGYDNGMDTPV